MYNELLESTLKGQYEISPATVFESRFYFQVKLAFIHFQECNRLTQKSEKKTRHFYKNYQNEIPNQQTSRHQIPPNIPQRSFPLQTLSRNFHTLMKTPSSNSHRVNISLESYFAKKKKNEDAKKRKKKIRNPTPARAIEQLARKKNHCLGILCSFPSVSNDTFYPL